MTITTIIPTYNREKFLPRCIESVLNQTIMPNEIILIDDGSIDNTREIASKYDIKYIRQENSGVSSARNLGIKNSNCEYITFLDSDDMWHNEKLEKQINFHSKYKDIKISHTNEKWIRDGKELVIKGSNTKKGGNIFIDILPTCTIGCSTVMIKKDLFDEIGLFDESFEICEDYDLWLRVAKKYEIGYIEDKLITKFAGEWEQLSFKYWGMDRWRIKALEKHSSYQEVRDEIIKKSKILLKGAIKKENQTIIDEYSKIIETYEKNIFN